MEKVNYGFLQPEILPENWVLGGILEAKKKVLNKDRDWLTYLPLGEIQRRNIETSSCTQYGTQNAIETLEKRLFRKTKNYSERFTAIGANNSKEGNDPHIVAEHIRKNGLLEEDYLPFTDEILTWEEYMSPDPLPRKLIRKAKKWLKIRKFNHEWIAPKGADKKVRLERIKEALQYSPIGVSVDAWNEKNGIYYKEDGAPDNHWCLLVAFKEYPIVFDSYLDDGAFLKKLDKNYDFGFAKLFTLEEIKLSCLGKLLNLW